MQLLATFLKPLKLLDSLVPAKNPIAKRIVNFACAAIASCLILPHVVKLTEKHTFQKIPNIYFFTLITYIFYLVLDSARCSSSNEGRKAQLRRTRRNNLKDTRLKLSNSEIDVYNLFNTYRYFNFTGKAFSLNSFLKILPLIAEERKKTPCDVLNTLDDNDYGNNKHYSIFWAILNSKTPKKHLFANAMLDNGADPNLGISLGFQDILDFENINAFVILLKLVTDERINPENVNTIKTIWNENPNKQAILTGATDAISDTSDVNVVGWKSKEEIMTCIDSIFGPFNRETQQPDISI